VAAGQAGDEMVEMQTDIELPQQQEQQQTETEEQDFASLLMSDPDDALCAEATMAVEGGEDNAGSNAAADAAWANSGAEAVGTEPAVQADAEGGERVRLPLPENDDVLPPSPPAHVLSGSIVAGGAAADAGQVTAMWGGWPPLAAADGDAETAAGGVPNPATLSTAARQPEVTATAFCASGVATVPMELDSGSGSAVAQHDGAGIAEVAPSTPPGAATWLQV
jgi:hypothetical protein